MLLQTETEVEVCEEDLESAESFEAPRIEFCRTLPHPEAGPNDEPITYGMWLDEWSRILCWYEPQVAAERIEKVADEIGALSGQTNSIAFKEAANQQLDFLRTLSLEVRY